MRAKVTDWNGVIVYEGPTPLPKGVGVVSVEDMADRHFYKFEFREDSETHASA